MRRKRKIKWDDEEEHLERWLLTYADLITLLLAFFVVMYSMSEIDAKKFGEMSEALHGILKGGESIFRQKNPDATTEGHGVLKIGNLRMLQKVIEKKSENRKELRDVDMELTERGLVVHIMERALFEEGSASLQSGATNVLDMIYSEFANLPNHIRVEGHTDDRSIATSQFPSNWELSSARATAVVRYFVDEHGCSPGRISALGYGMYRPIRPNNSIENRASNRRVDIVVLTMELSVKEPSSDMYNLASR